MTPCASDERPARALRPRYSALDNVRIPAAFGGLRQEAPERYRQGTPRAGGGRHVPRRSAAMKGIGGKERAC